MEKKNGVGIYWPMELEPIKGSGEDSMCFSDVKHGPFIWRPTCFCGSLIGLISCHSEVFSKWLEGEQLTAPRWCSSSFYLSNLPEGFLLGSPLRHSWIGIRQSTVICSPNRTTWNTRFPKTTDVYHSILKWQLNFF